jgi:hypothetical protein
MRFCTAYAARRSPRRSIAVDALRSRIGRCNSWPLETRCGTVCPERTVGSVLAHLVDRWRSCDAWIKSVRGVTYSPAPRTHGIVVVCGRHLCWRRESGFRWPDRAASGVPSERTSLAEVQVPSSAAGHSGRAGRREERSTSLTPTGLSHGQAIRVALTSTRIRHANTSAFRNNYQPLI